MVICIDFDGTCVTHEFPKIGKDIGAVPVLRKLVENGHQLILWTIRSDRFKKGDTGDYSIEDVTGAFLSDAVKWFKDNDIPLWGINENPKQQWSRSHKQYANLYIDDAALGCPLKYDQSISDRPYVDWEKIELYLRWNEIILK